MKAIKCVETGVIYKSLNAATQALGKTGVDKAANGVTKTCGGYHWEWLIDEIKPVVNIPKRKLQRAKEIIDYVIITSKEDTTWGVNFGRESRL